MSDFQTDVETVGVSVERTLDVVAKILDDVDFAHEVANHNKWPVDLTQDRIAVLFLTCRFQWAVDLLSRQTATLKQRVDSL